MALVVYVLCLVTAVGCAGVLLAGWRRSRAPLLLWAGLCFLGLAVNEGLVIADIYVIQGTSLLLARRVAGFLAVALMLVGLILHTEASSS